MGKQVVHYNIDKIDKTGANINIIMGERSNGKSYQIKHKKGINKWWDGGVDYHASYKDKNKVIEEIYILPEYRGKGLGRRLYGALIELLAMMGYRNLYGIVTNPNPPSFALHTAMGFRETGREHLAGFKRGEWRDVVLFERHIGGHENTADTAHWRDCPLRFDELGEAADAVLKKFAL